MNQIGEYSNYDINGNTYSKEEILDLFRLQKELLLKENIISTLEECANIWSNYSGDLAASWLYFPSKDDDILLQIKSSDYFTSFEKYASE